MTLAPALRPPLPSRTLRVLVADDDRLVRTLAERVFRKEGFEVLLAEDGTSAYRLYLEQAPDLVLTDYQMPRMTGAQLCQAIKDHEAARTDAPPRFLPTIVFTSSMEPAVLETCISAGAMEFLTKPFSAAELMIRVRPIVDLIRLHDLLAEEKRLQDEEIFQVKQLLGRLEHGMLKALPAGWAMETVATRRIRGDICGYASDGQGIHYGMLCDPMGHGLMAGVSDLPAVSVFRALSAKGFSLPVLFHEINRKLLQLMPAGRFSCLLLFRMDERMGTLEVLNAGMPEALLIREDGSTLPFPSRLPPAGILPGRVDLLPDRVALTPGDWFFACSDGFTDHLDPAPLLSLLRERRNGTALTQAFREAIQASLKTLAGTPDMLDDISWAMWRYPLALPPSRTEPAGPGEDEDEDPCTLSLDLTLDPREGNYHELGSDLAGFLRARGLEEGLAQHLSILATEGIVNAVDYGLLHMDSSVKQEGFEGYEEIRKQRLARLGQRNIQVRVRVYRSPGPGSGPHLEVEVEDPGRGFDWRTGLEQAVHGSEAPHGRGLLLLKTLAAGVRYNEAGNCLSFRLEPEGPPPTRPA